MNVIEADWATAKATRIIKGYRIVGGRGKDLRDDIARALRKIELEARIKQRTEDDAATDAVDPVQATEPPIEVLPPLADRIKTTAIRSYGGWHHFEAMGFADIEEARAWADRWCSNNMGYTPLASPTTTSDGSIIVFCKRWHSCD